MHFLQAGLCVITFRTSKSASILPLITNIRPVQWQCLLLCGQLGDWKAWTEHKAAVILRTEYYRLTYDNRQSACTRHTEMRLCSRHCRKLSFRTNVWFSSRGQGKETCSAICHQWVRLEGIDDIRMTDTQRSVDPSPVFQSRDLLNPKSTLGFKTQSLRPRLVEQYRRRIYYKLIRQIIRHIAKISMKGCRKAIAIGAGPIISIQFNNHITRHF